MYNKIFYTGGKNYVWKKKTAKKNVSLYEDEVFYVKDDKKVEEEKNDENHFLMKNYHWK